MQLEKITPQHRKHIRQFFQTICETHFQSTSTPLEIVKPCGNMDNETKDRYTVALTKILKTSKNDSEILVRAQKALKKIDNERNKNDKLG